MKRKIPKGWLWSPIDPREKRLRVDLSALESFDDQHRAQSAAFKLVWKEQDRGNLLGWEAVTA